MRQQMITPLASAGARAVGLAYIAYKGSATIVRTYERTVVPGLLQTEEYARTLQQSQVDGRLLL
ncbi:Scr1 family TA system antitoxin-like transcriptional regulator [Streptomyces sp. NPDC047990]|uniref:Scr1 family TA system antitoxin-like transcriptional regulator n=1 Tax=Streptomyces sp. NPDC047990 TaxID=3365496 RepID=UPI00371C4058